MSIGTYAQLKTAVENWRERVGVARITDNVADCIALGEARLTRELPLRVMWTNGPLTGTIASRELALPATFVEPKWLKLTSYDPYRELTKKTAVGMAYLTSSGEPTEWAINGLNIDLNRPCSSALAFQFRYRAKFALSDAAPTNWLLTNHPDIYLAAVLLWSGLLIRDKDIAIWSEALRAGIDQLTTLDAKADGDVELELDPALLSPGYWDGLTDTYL